MGVGCRFQHEVMRSFGQVDGMLEFPADVQRGGSSGFTRSCREKSGRKVL